MTKQFSRRRLLKTGAVGAAALAFGRTAPSAAYAVKPKPKPKPVSKAGQRKIIEIGIDQPDIDYLTANMGKVQAQSFDGVSFTLSRTPGITYVEGVQIFAKPGAAPATQYGMDPAHYKFDQLRALEWGNLTDNFIWTFTYAEAAGGTDWFDEDMWQGAKTKTRLLAEALNVSGAVGLAFDVEDYGAQTWHYNESMFPGRTYEEVCAKVRQRGEQFMTELQRGKSDVIVLAFELGFAMRYHIEQAGVRPESAPYATFPAFISGMLAALKALATIVDGSESADYYIDETAQFFGMQEYSDAAWYLLDPDVRARHGEIKRGSAVYVDAVLGQCRPGSWGASKFPYYDELTRADTDRWFEHNLYHAQLKSDRYVWAWTEGMRWWDPETHFPGASAGLDAAKGKFAAGEALGFDLCRSVGYNSRTTKPVVVSDDNFALSSTPLTAATQQLLLSTTGPAAPDVREVIFYDNGRRIPGISPMAPYRVGITVTPGAHTYVARAFLGNGNHATTNPILVNGQ